MLQKVVKIVFILLFLFCFWISVVSATDINLNLPGTTDNTVNNAIDNTTENTIVDNSVNNTTDNNVGNEQSTTNELTDQANSVNENMEDPFADVTTENLQPSGISTQSESGLGITNIINILLITVGVILILLGIAIMIRLKN